MLKTEQKATIILTAILPRFWISPVAAIPAALKFVENAVILVQGAELTAKVFMDLK